MTIRKRSSRLRRFYFGPSRLFDIKTTRSFGSSTTGGFPHPAAAFRQRPRGGAPGTKVLRRRGGDCRGVPQNRRDHPVHAGNRRQESACHLRGGRVLAGRGLFADRYLEEIPGRRGVGPGGGQVHHERQGLSHRRHGFAAIRTSIFFTRAPATRGRFSSKSSSIAAATGGRWWCTTRHSRLASTRPSPKHIRNARRHFWPSTIVLYQFYTR